MRIGLIILGLAFVYLVGHLLMVWWSRNSNLPKPPPGGWRKSGDGDREDDWPGPKPG